MRPVRRALAASIAAAAGLACLTGASVAAGGPAASKTTVVAGLDNPRDLTFTPDGSLYVAEAGHGGGASSCVTNPQVGELCPGFTSQISRIDLRAGTSTPVVTGLISIADHTGFGATGVDGIDAVGNDTLLGIITGASDFIPPGVFPPDVTERAQAQLGRLIHAYPDTGRWKDVGDVGHRDFVWASHHRNLVPGQFPDANPYGVLADHGQRWVVDAGSNTLDRVDFDGDVRVVAFFPNPPAADAVPTCIDRGPDGALYIGELTGGGNPPGSSVVWRFTPEDGLQQWATGLTAVTGCGFASDGSFYAVELSTLGLDAAAPGTGAVVRVPAHSTSPEVVMGGLDFPGGFAARGGKEDDGFVNLYTSNWSIAPAASGMGSVVRISFPR